MAPPSISLAATFPQNPKINQLLFIRRLSPAFCSASPTRFLTSVDSLRAKADLLRLISSQERGLRTQTNPSKREEIIRAIDELAVLGDGTVTTDSSLSGTWRMLWTTEKEQLFIIKNARLFGTEAGDVLQVIDVERGLLNNVITFPPSGVFFVRSEIEVEPPQRVNFRYWIGVPELLPVLQILVRNRVSTFADCNLFGILAFGSRFTSAVLRGSKWEIPLPPFGQGW